MLLPGYIISALAFPALLALIRPKKETKSRRTPGNKKGKLRYKKYLKKGKIYK